MPGRDSLSICPAANNAHQVCVGGENGKEEFDFCFLRSFVQLFHGLPSLN